MRNFGIFLTLVGIIVVVASCSMDTSVVTTYGNRVNNLGLMRDQSNYMMIGGLVVLVGIVLFVAGARKDPKGDRRDISESNEYIDTLEKLISLKERGALTDEEFSDKKSALDDRFYSSGDHPKNVPTETNPTLGNRLKPSHFLLILLTIVIMIVSYIATKH